MKIDWKKSKYDFIDFGSKVGGSMDFAKKVLGGTNGLGVDIRPEFVKKAQDAGFDVVVGDATKLDVPPKVVKFAVLSHFLEHLPSLEEVKKSIESAVRISTDFVYIKGPVFDDDEYLKSLGLKTYWADWEGHPCHLTTSDLRRILKELGHKDWEINFFGKMTDSNDPAIHSLQSPINQHDYDSKVHPSKKYAEFSYELKKEFECYIYLNRMKKSLFHPLKKSLYSIWKRILPSK